MSDYDFSMEPEGYRFQLRSTSTHTPLTDEDKKKHLSLMSELDDVLTEWSEEEYKISYNPIPHVTRVAEIIEESIEEFLRRDPDPLDDRHPHRTHPKSTFGNLLRLLFRNDTFMNKLVISYILGRDNAELSIQGCRVLLGCVPGIDSNVVFSEPDDFITRLYTWAKDSSNETLQAYAMGLLSAALEVQENASKYRHENLVLVPIALRRLKELKTKMENERQKENQNEYPYTNFAHLIKEDESGSSNDGASSSNADPNPQPTVFAANSRIRPVDDKDSNSSQPPRKKRKTKTVRSLPNTNQPRIPSFTSLQNLDNSNSKWDILQPFLIGTHKIYPLTLSMYQRLIFQYLGPTGEYQDLLSMTYEGNAIDLIMDYIDLEKSQDVRLTFDAIKYLTSLLVHRKFALEFVARGGVETLLKIPKTSLASDGVVTALYYISYNCDVMETVCQLDDRIVDEVVNYNLWCLEHSHESGMASAAMFIAHALYYRCILERFDQMDGPRKLYNYISTLTIVQDVAAKEEFDLSEEQIHTSTQCVRNVCNAFRSYVAAHLFVKLESIRKTLTNKSSSSLAFPSTLTDVPGYKSMKINEEHIWDCQLVLANLFRVTHSVWRPIEELRRIGLVKTLIGCYVLSPNWNPMTGRNEMMTNALEVIAICCCLPKVQLELIETHTFVHITTDGISACLETASPQPRDDKTDSSVRISALRVLITCTNVHPEVFKKLDILAAPKSLNNAIDGRKSDGRKSSNGSQSPARTLLETMWAAVRKSNGIMILMDLINTKEMMDADNVRYYACFALTGIARCEQVRQLLSKTPLIANNGLQALMREPIVQDKRNDHVRFTREAVFLLQVVTGKTMKEHLKDLTQEKMHKQWIVENTKINFNEKELLQLIHEHLAGKGLKTTAAMLRNEADLPDVPASRVPLTPAKLKPLPHYGNSMTAIESSLPTLTPRASSSTSSTSRRMAAYPSTSSEGPDDVFATPSINRRNTAQNKSLANFPRRFYISPAKPKALASNTDGSQFKPHRPLDDILTEYFRTQHSHCSNPVTTCPPFSLYFPHRCPEPSTLGFVSSNLARRHMLKDIMRPHERMVATWQDEKYSFGRFKPSRVIHEHEETYTSAAFSIDDEHLIVGMFSGEVHWINIETGQDESTTNCHNSAISHIEPSSDGSMLLTSSAFVRPLSALWRLGEAMDLIRVFHEEQSVLFSNQSLDKIVGTYGGRATVYDTETNHALAVFNSPEFEEPRFLKNIASFSPCDKLVFNDGLLWDVRDPLQSLHTFDKLSSSTLNGVFHPHGNQVIINTEVNMMYGAKCEDAETEEFSSFSSTTFRTFDTSDYSVNATMDMKKAIIGMCASHGDQMMGVIEKLRPLQHEFSLHSSSQVRLLEVGKQKDAEDDVDNDDEEEENNEDDDDESESEDSIGMGDDDDEDDDGDDMNDDASVLDMDEGIFGALNAQLGRIVESDEELDHFDEMYQESVSSQVTTPSSSSDSSDSSGWETDSQNGDQDPNGGGNAANGGGGGGNGGNRRGGPEEDEEEDDANYEPEFRNDYNSISSTALNPHLRRRNQGEQ